LSEKDSRGKIKKVKEYLKKSSKCGAARKASPAA
jgi:hypothetical protein